MGRIVGLIVGSWESGPVLQCREPGLRIAWCACHCKRRHQRVTAACGTSLSLHFLRFWMTVWNLLSHFRPSTPVPTRRGRTRMRLAAAASATESGGSAGRSAGSTSLRALLRSGLRAFAPTFYLSAPLLRLKNVFSRAAFSTAYPVAVASGSHRARANEDATVVWQALLDLMGGVAALDSGETHRE